MPHSIIVTDTNFEYEVLAYSAQMPVVVDFWAAWCIPCKISTPLLENLAEQAEGRFRLAKVDVDANPKLTRQFGVRTVPAIKAFRDGQIMGELSGAQPEAVIRDFIQAIIPSDFELALEKGLSLLELTDWGNAEDSFREYLEHKPEFPLALLGLARSLLGQGFFDEAQRILTRFPASKEYATAETLLPLVKALVWAKGQTPSGDDPLLAGYLTAMRLVTRGNFAAALDGLLDVLRQNKRYRDGEARRVTLGLFELLGPKNPLTVQYRSELAMVLF